MHKNSYNPKSLNGNWYENRQTSDFEAVNNGSNTYLSNPSYNKYVPISRDVGNKSSYNKEAFGSATDNWMNFQPAFKTDETFKTTNGTSFCGMGDRGEPFKLKQTSLTANDQALEDYRNKYTRSNHNFNRTYLGAAKWKKSDQEDPQQ